MNFPLIPLNSYELMVDESLEPKELPRWIRGRRVACCQGLRYMHTHTLINNDTKRHTHIHAIMLEDTYVQRRVHKANFLALLFKKGEPNQNLPLSRRHEGYKRIG